MVGETRASSLYPSVFGCKKLNKMYVFNILCQSFSQETPVCTIQLCLGCKKWTKCVFEKFPIYLSLTNPSLHYPTVFGLHEMTKLCVLKVPYQSAPYKTHFALSNCVWVAWNDQNVCFNSSLSVSALQNPVCTIQLCLGCMKWPKCVF